MWPIMHDLGTSGLQADALFASRLQRCDEPSADQVRQAIATAIGEFGYPGCAARVAQEFGDHPETAVIRMRWARAVAGAAFAHSGQAPGPLREADWLLIVRPQLPSEQLTGSAGIGRG